MKQDLLTRVTEEFELEVRPEHFLVKKIGFREVTMADLIRFAVREALKDAMRSQNKALKEWNDLG